MAARLATAETEENDHAASGAATRKPVIA